MSDQNAQIEVITNLLGEFKEHRDEIKKMITEIESIRTQVDGLFPEKLDKRFLNLFEERVKAVSNLFNTLLDMRKEITKSIKDEIELRRRMLKEGVDGRGEIEDMLDVRSIAKKVEQYRKTTEKIIGDKDKCQTNQESKSPNQTEIQQSTLAAV